MTTLEHLTIPRLKLGWKTNLGKDTSQHKLTVGGEEEDAPVETEHVHQLEPGEVLVLGVAHKLARGAAALLLAPFEPGYLLNSLYFYF